MCSPLLANEVLSEGISRKQGVAGPGLGGQRTPRGKGKGKDMGKNKRRIMK